MGREDRTRGNRDRSSFEYKARSKDQVSKRATQSGGDYDKYINESVKMFKPADGTNIVRILPPTWDGAEHFGLDIYVHFGIGSDNQAYLCLDKMKGEPCPICEELQRVKSEGGDEEYEKQLYPTKRVMVAIIDRDKEKEGPVVWPMSWTMDRDIGKLMIDKRSGEIYAIDHPEEGFDVEFDKEGKGLKTKYSGLAIARKPSELGNDKWLQFMVDNPLPDLLQYYSYDHIAKVFTGKASKASKQKDDENDKKLDSKEYKASKNMDSPELTWESVHSMSFDELSAILEDQKLNEINPDQSNDDEELADWICEELNIKKETGKRRVVEEEPSEEEDSPRERLAKMRRNKGD